VELRETQRAVTPFGGLVVFFEFLWRIGYREAVRQHLPFPLNSPNAIDPVETFTGVLLSVVVGARRFAHTSLLRADTALHALLGISRFPIDDTVCFGQEQYQRFFRGCGTGSSNGCRNILRGTVWIWTPRCSNATGISKVPCGNPTRASMDGLRIIRWWRCWRNGIFFCTAGCAATKVEVGPRSDLHYRS
jgi:hypothetical protein